MGTQDATHPVDVGVAGIINVVTSLKPEQNGQFINFMGEQVPW